MWTRIAPKHRWCIVVLALFIGCATAPPLTQLEIDPGPYPTTCDSIILSYLKARLYDPDSLMGFYIHTKPNKIVISRNMPASNLRRGMQAYRVLVYYNAKNQYGGYVGSTPMIVFIRNGRVVATF